MKLVIFDTDNTNLTSIGKVIKTQKEWVCISPTAWLVDGNLSYNDLRDILAAFNPKHLVIIPFDYRYWASFNCSQEINEFLGNHALGDY